MCFIDLSKLPLRQHKYLYTNFKFEFYNFAENVAIHSNSLIETTQKQREVPINYLFKEGQKQISSELETFEF